MLLICALAFSTAGCTAIQAAGVAAEDAFVPLENIGRFDHWRQQATFDRLIADGQPASFVEIGRRFGDGDRLPRDRDCAAWWYERAYFTPYVQELTTYSNGMVVSGGKVTRPGYPQARVAYKKLIKGGPARRLDAAEASMRCEKSPGS
jgi:hypothetical protein